MVARFALLAVAALANSASEFEGTSALMLKLKKYGPQDTKHIQEPPAPRTVHLAETEDQNANIRVKVQNEEHRHQVVVVNNSNTPDNKQPINNKN